MQRSEANRCDSHNYELLFFERREYLQMLYDRLPDKSRIQFSKKVVDIKEFYNGVKVTSSDGTVEQGDIVIGCDGIHSFVRQKMWDRADKISPGLISIKERKGKLNFQSIAKKVTDF